MLHVYVKRAIKSSLLQNHKRNQLAVLHLAGQTHKIHIFTEIRLRLKLHKFKQYQFTYMGLHLSMVRFGLKKRQRPIEITSKI